MKARIKSTGEIVNVEHKMSEIFSADNGYDYPIENLDFNVDQTDWKQLHIQIAVSALSGIVSNQSFGDQYNNDPEYKEIGSMQKVAAIAADMYATELVNVLKRRFTNE